MSPSPAPAPPGDMGNPMGADPTTSPAPADDLGYWFNPNDPNDPNKPWSQTFGSLPNDTQTPPDENRITPDPFGIICGTANVNDFLGGIFGDINPDPSACA